MAHTVDNGKPSGLVRGLGAWAATAVVIGVIIGQAIFLVPSDVARNAGSVGRALMVWSLGAVVVLFGSFCYAELGGALPEAGGDYVYLSRGLGPLWGFLFGWMTAFIQRPAASALIAAGFLRFTGFLLPAATIPIFTWHTAIPFQTQPLQFTFTAAQPLAAAVIGAVTIINYFGVRTAGRVQLVLTGLKVAAMIVIVVLGLTLGKLSGLHSSPISASATYGGVGAFLAALVPAMYAYNGFQHLGCVGGEIINPQRNIPRAVISGVLFVVGLFTLINLVYFRVLGFSQVAQSQHVASDVIVRLAGASGAKWLTVAMMISALGALHVLFLTGPRVSYAMAHDGQFFGFAGRIQPVFHTPSGALVFQGCMAVMLVLTGTYEQLYSLMVFAVWIFFMLTAIALVRLRRKEPALFRPYRAWGYPWTQLIFAAAAFAMTANIWLIRPVRSSIGLAIILLGAPFFFYWRRRATAVLEKPPMSAGAVAVDPSQAHP
jgi:basic amino acid/polyamine antiporter, APA family